MKLITNIEVIISLSLFFSVFTFFFFFFTSSQYSQILLIRENKNLIKSFSISQILIYLNHSYSLSALNYTLLNYSKILSFFNYCQQNKEKIKSDFGVKDFYIFLSCPSSSFYCFTKNVEKKVKRVVVVNNSICYLEVGVE
jgi:hypothetical protein